MVLRCIADKNIIIKEAKKEVHVRYGGQKKDENQSEGGIRNSLSQVLASCLVGGGAANLVTGADEPFVGISAGLMSLEISAIHLWAINGSVAYC